MGAKFLFFIFLTGSAALVLGIDDIYDAVNGKHNYSQEQIEKGTTQSSLSNTISINQPLFTVLGEPSTVINGFDWSLPPSTKVEPYSGLIGEGGGKHSAVSHKFIMVLWNESNPRKGIYDFSRFENELKKLSSGKFLVRLEVNSSCEAPAWVLKNIQVSKEKSLIFWNKNYKTYLKDFVEAFSKRFAGSPKIAGVHLGIADGEFSGDCNNYDNKNGWGEFWMSPSSIAEAEKMFGFSPQVFETSTKEIIDIYTNAFRQFKYKLAFTNIGPTFSWDEISVPYNKRLRNIAHYAFKKGVGNRDGGTEQWMSFIDEIYGNKITSMKDGSCRLDFDEDYAKKISGRYWGSENEFYGNKDYVVSKHGSYKNQPYRYLVSSLRALQMRRNFFSVSDGSMAKMKSSVYKTQDFMTYLTKVMGKKMENTPDAFVLLGERYVSAHHADTNHLKAKCIDENGDKIPFRSFGRWLTDEGDSMPALKIKMPKSEKFWAQNYYLPEGVDYEYSARKAKQFRFNINDELTQKRCDGSFGCLVEIKVTFKDINKTSLIAKVEEGQSHALETNGDQKIKTATFMLNSQFKNGIAGTDFLIESAQQDIPIILIRVNFL